ncbi:hypothetical protein [Breoghania sp. L-A4]|uniref:hypothetical protein n=1 Tax=Breoghania sp. L-A4 TaxID=2304600 RepID=UPI0013C3772E|nr:hypothetical protein [Breoghania sp. L-A4]
MTAGDGVVTPDVMAKLRIRGFLEGLKIGYPHGISGQKRKIDDFIYGKQLVNELSHISHPQYGFFRWIIYFFMWITSPKVRVWPSCGDCYV